MAEPIRLSVLALAAAISALVLRKYHPEYALLVAVLGCVLGAVLLLTLASPLFSLIRKLAALTEKQDELLAPLLKCVGIGLMTQITSALCLDAGEAALAKITELGGSLLCILAALPLLEEVLELIRTLVGFRG